MIRTLEEAIIHAEETANDYEEMIGDYALDSEKLAKCAKNQRQIAAWLRELAERRKAPEIVRCGEVSAGTVTPKIRNVIADMTLSGSCRGALTGIAQMRKGEPMELIARQAIEAK